MAILFHFWKDFMIISAWFSVDYDMCFFDVKSGKSLIFFIHKTKKPEFLDNKNSGWSKIFIFSPII